MSLNREFSGEIERDLFRACMLLPDSCRMECEEAFLFSFPILVARASKKSPTGKTAVNLNWGGRVDDAKEVAEVITKIMFGFHIPVFNMGRQRTLACSKDDLAEICFSLIGNTATLKNEFYVEVTFKKGPAPTN